LSTVTLLSGGVGGARLARGLAAVLRPDDLTIVVNVGDDERIYGLHVSPDIDTVLYTLAGIEGPYGWGMAEDTFTTMDRLSELGVDASFRIGDRDLATNLMRTAGLDTGETLSGITARMAAALGIGCRVIPASDERVRTTIDTAEGEHLSFQEYFVLRGHRDAVAAVHHEGAARARPAPEVIEAIEHADLVVIGPSNPPLSIWPILAVPGIREAVAAAPVAAVSPLFGGKALKGPADRVMAAVGLPAGSEGVVAAYDGLLDLLVIDIGDADDVPALEERGIRAMATDTRIAEPGSAAAFAARLLEAA
jgi:LPPG:FO 2-phospho-L-lactate transferase